MTIIKLPQTPVSRALHAFCGRNKPGHFAFMVCVYEDGGAFLSFHVDFTTRRFWVWHEDDAGDLSK